MKKKIGVYDKINYPINIQRMDTIYKIDENGKIVRLVTEQPNRINGSYPDDYVGDENDGGNRIRILSKINNEWVHVAYMHLKPGSVNLAIGQTIEKGQLIGYGGISGNSYEMSPVLHIQMNSGTGINGTGYGASFEPLINHINYISTSNAPCGPSCIRHINYFKTI